MDAKLTPVNEIKRNLIVKQVQTDSLQMPEGKIMTLTEVTQKDGQTHLYVESAITSGTTQ